MSTIQLWTRRDPFAEFDALVRRAFGPVGTRPTARTFSPAAEVTRDGDDALVRLELPGVKVTDDVTVEVADGRLVVRGERRDTRGEGAFSEVRYGSFRRSFGLPAHLTADAVSASYDAGVLSVRVAGAYAGTEARTIEIAGVERPAVETAETVETPAVETVDAAEGEQK